MRDDNHHYIPVQPFHGLLDEVMIWSRALDASEVAALYTMTGGRARAR